MLLLPSPVSLSTLPSPSGCALFVDSKRLNGRFRSRPSYDHPAVSGSPLVELHPREFVVALFHELRPLMRGLGSRAPLRRQTISGRVRIRRMFITTATYRVRVLFPRLTTTVFPTAMLSSVLASERIPCARSVTRGGRTDERVLTWRLFV